MAKYPHKTAIYLTLALLILSSGCNKFSKKIDSGRIKYNITYLTTKEENPIVVLLPQQMITYFDDDKTLTTISGFFGTFNLSLLTRPDLDKKYVLLRILDKKFMYETGMEGKPLGQDEMADLKIILTDSTFSYKNFNCKLAKAYSTQMGSDTFPIIYTNDIKVKDPNASTPFDTIPGVILKTRLKLFNVIMDIDFDELSQPKITSETFAIPEGYTKITLDQMEKFIKSFEK